LCRDGGNWDPPSRLYFANHRALSYSVALAFVFGMLKVGPEGKLQDPRKIELTGDYPEVRCSLSQTGITELHAVEEIEGFSPKLDIDIPITIDGE
jgi:hypothetical protein